MNWKSLWDEGVFISWRSLFLLGVLSPFTVVFIFFAMTNSAAPQWFQAIGSIIAIFVAVWIAKKDEMRRRRDRHTDAVIQMKNVLAVSRSAAEELNDIVRRAMTYDDNELTADETVKSDLLRSLGTKIDRKIRELQTVDVVSIRSHDFADSFLRFRSGVEMAINLMDICLEPPVSQKLHALSDWGKGTAAYVALMQKSIDKYSEQHGVEGAWSEP